MQAARRQPPRARDRSSRSTSSRPEDLEALAGASVGANLDLLFVNAGVSGPAGKTAVDATREDVADVLWTNAIAPLRVANRTAVRACVDGGTVAFMSSVMGSVGENTFGGHDLYRVSKGALNMLARNFELAIPRDRRIAVLCLHPGWVRTDMGGDQAPSASKRACAASPPCSRRSRRRRTDTSITPAGKWPGDVPTNFPKS